MSVVSFHALFENLFPVEIAWLQRLLSLQDSCKGNMWNASISKECDRYQEKWGNIFFRNILKNVNLPLNQRFVRWNALASQRNKIRNSLCNPWRKLFVSVLCGDISTCTYFLADRFIYKNFNIIKTKNCFTHPALPLIFRVVRIDSK